MSETGSSDSNSSGLIKKKGRFTVDLDHPLPDLDLKNADAYAASFEKDSSSAFALIVHPDSIPRWHAAKKLRGKEIESGLTLLDSARLYLPREGRHRYALIYRQPVAGDFFRLKGDMLKAHPPQVVINRFLKPAVETLKELHKKDITHRAIRHDNFLHCGNKPEAILGDCFAAPHAAGQTMAAESLPMATANPLGRGPGTASDDLFTLGTLILELSTGTPLAAGIDDKKFLRDRLELGSVNAYAQRFKFLAELEDAIRGLLNDDPKERWTLTELSSWIGGQTPKPKHSKAPSRAPRPVVVGGEHCFTRQAAADALGDAWQKADPIIKSGDFDGWLRRGLSDPETAKSIADLMGADHKLSTPVRVSRATMLLDPPGPIRHGGIATHLGGVGTLMVTDRDRTERRQALARLIDNRLGVHWISAQEKTGDETLSKHVKFDRASTLLAGGDGGLGYERVMYELCQDVHCLSPVLEDQMILDLKDLLPALEKAAKNKQLRGEVVDAHILAFMAARHKSLSENWIRSINREKDRYGQVVAIVRLLSYLQQQYNTGPLPHLCERIETLLRPIVIEFKNKLARKRILETIEKAAKSGTLAKLLAPVDDPQALSKDKKLYKAAIKDHAKANEDINALKNNSDRMKEVSQRIGELAGAAVSGVVGSIIVVVILFDALVNF